MSVVNIYCFIVFISLLLFVMENIWLFFFLLCQPILGEKSIFGIGSGRNSGASQCYVCVDECEDPIATHFCEEVLELEEGATAACLHHEVQTETESSVSKGCILDSPDIRETCATSSILYPGISCSLCTTDLCNGNNEEDEDNTGGVEECYFCNNNCTAPLGVQNCKNELGSDVEAVCIAANLTFDGQHYDIRSCVENSVQTQQLCASAGLLGGTCSLCDTNLCNDFSVGEEVDSVEECYFCDHPCEDPLKIHNCNEMWGSNSKMSCITINIPSSNGERYESRGCTENTAANQQICAAINYLSGDCNMCTSNLCNARVDDGNNDGNSACLCRQQNVINIILFVVIFILFKI